MLPESARTKPSVQGYPLLKWINIVLSEPLGCEPSHCSINCHLTFSFFSSFSHTSHCLQLLHRGFTSYFQKASGKSDCMSHSESWWGLWLGCCHVSALQQRGLNCVAIISQPINNRLGRLCLMHNTQIIIETREGRVSISPFCPRPPGVNPQSPCIRMSRALH